MQNTITAYSFACLCDLDFVRLCENEGLGCLSTGILGQAPNFRSMYGMQRRLETTERQISAILKGRFSRPQCACSYGLNQELEKRWEYSLVYVIKFIYSFFTPPGIFPTALFVLSFFAYKRNKLLFRWIFCMAIVQYLLVIPITGQLLLQPLEQKYSVPSKLDGDVLVMLGGGATLDTQDMDGRGIYQVPHQADC